MRNILVLSLLCLACALGCGKQGFNVGGKVTFSDGTPVHSGQVTLVSGSFSAAGDIIAGGSYGISNRVPTGTYKVSVRSNDGAPSEIDPKFNDPETSGLVCEVKGPTAFNIEVNRIQE